MSGTWPLYAKIIQEENLDYVVAKMKDKNVFNTSPMPFPSVAKDEKGYNPKGEYWLGGVWINMSLIGIRGLEVNGYTDEARYFSAKTLDAIARTYLEWDNKPYTIWELYAPEYPAPSSHKRNHPEKLGTVRSDFKGWTGCLINIMIENYFGIKVNAPENAIDWNISNTENYEVSNLKFGDVVTDLSFDKEGKITVNSNKNYTLRIIIGDETTEHNILPGKEKIISLKF